MFVCLCLCLYNLTFTQISFTFLLIIFFSSFFYRNNVTHLQASSNLTSDLLSNPSFVVDEMNSEHLYCNLPIIQSATSHEVDFTKQENVSNNPPVTSKFSAPVLSTLGSIGSRAPVCMEASEVSRQPSFTQKPFVGNNFFL